MSTLFPLTTLTVESTSFGLYIQSPSILSMFAGSPATVDLVSRIAFGRNSSRCLSSVFVLRLSSSSFARKRCRFANICGKNTRTVL